MTGHRTGTDLDASAALVEAWRRGDFHALAAVDAMELAQHPHRASLALVRLASLLERGDLAAASQAAAAARSYGVASSSVTAVVLAAAHRDIMRARASQERPEEAADHGARAAALVSGLSSADPPSPVPRVLDDGAALRTEVQRLRTMIDGLRKGGDGDAPRADVALIERICAANLTYLSRAKLRLLARTARAVEEQRVPGIFLEAGCALGGSAILLARIKKPARALQVYDVFGMIPPPSENDPPEVHARYRLIVDGGASGLGGDRYYGYEVDLLQVVRANFGRFDIDLEALHVRLVQGMVQDTLALEGPVALAHIDLDWHDPVQTCLERIFPRLSVGGSIIVDDYHDWQGARITVDDFIEANRDSLACDDSAQSMKLTRVRGGDSA
jgi:asparagine synthase (glutamine-hydrolysing)